MSDPQSSWQKGADSEELEPMGGRIDRGRCYWVFAAGLTNVRTEILVTDTATNVMKVYTNPQGTPFQPIQDTDAFATCP